MRNLIIAISLSLLVIISQTNAASERLSVSATMGSDGRSIPIDTKHRQKKLYSEGKPNLYATGDPVELWVDSLTSNTEPYSLEYYRFPFCQPYGDFRMEDLYFGEFLAGDRTAMSPYKIEMGTHKVCETLCVADVGQGQQKGTSNKLVRAISNNYHNNWILDGLAAAAKEEDDSTVTTRYWQGFPIGFVADDTGLVYIHNHVNIEIQYRQADESSGKFEIVLFTVEPFSIKHDYDIVESMESPGETKIVITNPISSCKPGHYDTAHHTTYEQLTDTDREPQPPIGPVLFTYDVIWIRNDGVDWSHRWDIYMGMDGADGIYLHILINFVLGSIGFSLLLAYIIGIKVHRLLKRQQYQALTSSTDGATGTSSGGGIQTLHREVFRAPDSAPRLLVFFCASGVHLWTTILIMTAVLVKMQWNPEHMRAIVILVGLVAFALGGFANGLTTALAMIAFFGQPSAVDRSVLFAPMRFPIMIFAYCEVLNVYNWNKGGSSVPFAHLHIAAFVWFGIATPIAVLGSYVGHYRGSGYKAPFVSSSLRRPIPPQPRHSILPSVMLLGGLPPFISFGPTFSMFMDTVWRGIYNIHYGWGLVSFIATAVMCALTSILFMMIQFQKENHQWWWRAFFTGGSPAFYLFFYIIDQDEMIGLYPALCHLFACTFVFLATGVTSVASCLVFNIFLFQKLPDPNFGYNEQDDEVGDLMINEPSAE
jgi:transmembrane 9 superfamily protein 2/4